MVVKRIDGSDGTITCKFETINYESGGRSAVAGEDYEHVSGEIIFKEQETAAEIEIPIVAKEIIDGHEYDGMFGLRLF